MSQQPRITDPKSIVNVSDVASAVLPGLNGPALDRRTSKDSSGVVVLPPRHATRAKLRVQDQKTGSDQDRSFELFSPTLEQRLRLVSQWGDFSLAWSLGVQKGLSYFGNESAMIGFAEKWGNVYALADPLGPHEIQGELLDQFLDRFPKACFVQCKTSTAKLLTERGFYINEMGIDTQIDLSDYKFSGKQKESLRYATNWLARREFQIVEDNEIATSKLATKEISDAWRKTRTVKSREVAFLNRPLDMQSEWTQPLESNEVDGGNKVRRFYLADAQGQRVAFVFFDPIFESGRIVGYVTSFKRRLPDAPSHAELGITKHAIEVFQAEDRRFLFLGLSPLAEIENQWFRKNPFLHFSFRYLYRSTFFNRFFYPLQGHAEFKQKFRGESRKVHYASRTIVNDFRLIGLLKLCRVI